MPQIHNQKAGVSSAGGAYTTLMANVFQLSFLGARVPVLDLWRPTL